MFFENPESAPNKVLYSQGFSLCVYKGIPWQVHGVPHQIWKDLWLLAARLSINRYELSISSWMPGVSFYTPCIQESQVLLRRNSQVPIINTPDFSILFLDYRMNQGINQSSEKPILWAITENRDKQCYYQSHAGCRLSPFIHNIQANRA